MSIAVNGYRKCDMIVICVSVCGMEHDSALKKEILPFVTTRMNLESITRSEMSQAQEEKRNARSHLHVESKRPKLIKAERKIVVTRGGDGEILVRCYKVTVLWDA